jgi:hypothetical protein
MIRGRKTSGCQWRMGHNGYRKEIRGDGMERVSRVGHSRYMEEVRGGGVE